MNESALEALQMRFNTVGAFWHDAYAEWQVKVDPQRRTFDDCRYEGWSYELDEAASAALNAANSGMEAA